MAIIEEIMVKGIIMTITIIIIIKIITIIIKK